MVVEEASICSLRHSVPETPMNLKAECWVTGSGKGNVRLREAALERCGGATSKQGLIGCSSES